MSFYFAVGYWNRDWFQRRRALFLFVLLPIGVLLYVVPMLSAPSGGKTDGCVRNAFLSGRRTWSRYSPWNVIPEVDQINVGMTLYPLGERQMSFAESARMRSLVLPLYAEMDRDAGFRDLGSVMEMAYRDIFHCGGRTGHFFVFLPCSSRSPHGSNRSNGDSPVSGTQQSGPSHPRTSKPSTAGKTTTVTNRFPCLIFLHGLGGNAKAPLWVLSRFAHEGKCVVVAPTFGMGNWDRPDGAELVVDVARQAIATLPVDPKRIFLMGYSNGAMGVTRAAVRLPELFKGLIYLSPVTEDEFFPTKEFFGSREGPQNPLSARRQRPSHSTLSCRGNRLESETPWMRRSS